MFPRLDRSGGEEILPLSKPLAEQGYRYPAITARLGADYHAFRADWLRGLEAELGAGEASE